MNTIPEALLNTIKEVYDECGYPDFAPEDNIQVMKEGEWVSEGKYEHKQDVVYSKEYDIYIGIGMGRSGSYYSDYYHDDNDYYEVYPQEVTVTKYIPVRNMTKAISAAKAAPVAG